MRRFDVIVCGLGAMGSATLERLARRGKRVLGVERYAPGHERGSSHGATRIIRLSYFEHPSYVPMLYHAYALWRELEQASGLDLLHRTGIAEIGLPDSTLITGTLASIRLHNLPHDTLTASELMRRLPIFSLPADYVAVLQPDGGWLAVEPAFEAWLSLARREGAKVLTGASIHAIEPRSGGLHVHTDQGSFEAGTAVVTAGAWTKSVLPSLAAPLVVTRQVMGWFRPQNPALCSSTHLPVFMLESAHGVHYGIPPSRPNAGIKVAKHHHSNQVIDPDNYCRSVSQADEALIRAALADHVPAANGPLIAAKTCLYTLTPDGDFLIDRLPGAPEIVVASACSGHGFKFAPLIGEMLADLATGGDPRHDITRFRLGRFG